MELGLLRLQQGQLAAAVSAFRKVLEIDPDHGPTNRHLAEVYLRQGQYSRASSTRLAPRSSVSRCPTTNASCCRINCRNRRRKPELRNERARWLATALLCGGLGLAIAPSSISGQANGAKADRPALFVDVTARRKIDFVHKSGASPEKYMVETFGSGVAWIDYDNDGFQDLYFVNGAPGAANALYHNNQDGTFKRRDRAGPRRRQRRRQDAYKTGVAVGDYDNNGYLDLYVTASAPTSCTRTTATARSRT